MVEQDPTAVPLVMAESVNCKRASSGGGTQRGYQDKKSKSMTDPSSRPKPQKKIRGDTTEAADTDSFDLHRRHVV
jgi:hypothetical protein